MGLPKQFAQLSKIIFGQTASSNLKMTDMMAVQHVDISGSTGVNTLNQISVAQALCEPVAISTTNNPSNGAYVATCENYPDFSITYKDNNDTDHYLYGLKVRVRFDHGITYGAVGGNTPTLNINGSGALQILAQGKPVGKGAATDGQFLELTLVPYGNSVAWDADSNVLESTSDYTIYTDGTNQSKNCIKYLFSGIATANGIDTGLSVNGGSRGRTYVLIGSAQWDNGNSTASILWLIRCGYNGNNWQVVRIVEEHVSETFPLNISLTGGGNIFLQSNGGLWYCSIFSNKQ